MALLQRLFLFGAAVSISLYIALSVAVSINSTWVRQFFPVESLLFISLALWIASFSSPSYAGVNTSTRARLVTTVVITALLTAFSFRLFVQYQLPVLLRAGLIIVYAWSVWELTTCEDQRNHV